jgi:hypothetical protein
MKDMVVDSNGYIYVLVDDFFYGPYSNPVQRYVIKLNNDGGLVKGIGTQSITTNNGYNIISSLGTGDGQFIYPASISIDSFDNLYVLDPGNNRVQKFDSSGNFLTKFDVLLSDVSCNTSSYSCSGGGLSNEILIDSSGKIYVTDYGKEQIQIFDKIGSTMNVDSSLIAVNAIIQYQ